MTDETFQPDAHEETVDLPETPAEETAAKPETPDLFAADGEAERFEAEGEEPIFADDAVSDQTPDAPAGPYEAEPLDGESVDGTEDETEEDEANRPGALSGLKKRLPIIAAVAAIAVAAILACTLFMPKKSPADAVLGYVDDLLEPNATDVAMKTVGVPADETLLTVEGVDVSAEEYLYWLGNITSYYDMVSSYSGSAMDLTREAQEGVTWDQQLKLAARDNSVLLALVPGLAKEFGVELTAEDLQGVADSRAANIESVGGVEMYAYQLQAMGVSDAAALKLEATSILYGKVQEAWLDRLAQDLTDEAVAQYVEENDVLKAKHILLLTVDQATGQSLDAATVAQKKARADELLAQLRADPTKFDELMQANSEDTGLATNPDGYTFTAGSMVAPFEEGTRALEYGQISDVIESEFGYHIILRLDPDSDQLRQEVAYEDFNAAVQERVDQADVVESEAYASFTTADYYEKLLDFQKTLTRPEAADQSEPNVVDQSQAELEPAS